MQSGGAVTTPGSASIVPMPLPEPAQQPGSGPVVTSPATSVQQPQQQSQQSQVVSQPGASGASLSPVTTAAGAGAPGAPAQQGSASPVAQAAMGQRRPHLYIGNLSSTVTEPMLHDIFSTAGPLASVKIIPERNQNNAYGAQQPPQPTRYAFVEYVDLRSAEQALQTLNGRKLHDHEIRVNWAHQATANLGVGGGHAGNGAHPGGYGNKADEAHVFVGDLAPEVNDEALRKAFGAFGSLSEARVMWDQVSGKSRGYGFLTFRSRADAEQAIATMNGEWLGSRAIRVNWANQKNSGGGPGASHLGGPGGMGGGRGGGPGGPHPSMHGGGPHGAYHAGMGGPHMMGGMGMPGAPFGMGGPPPHHHSHPPGGSSMPPGMPLTYEQTLAASHLHNTTVYVGNLLPFTTQNDLIPYFQNYGYITEVRMQADRGFAFVRLDSHENAAMAISQLNGTLIHNRPIKCGWGKDRPGGGRASGGGAGGGGGGGAGGVMGGAAGGLVGGAPGAGVGGAAGAGGAAGVGPGYGGGPPPPQAGGAGAYGNMMYAQYPYGSAFGYPVGMGMPATTPGTQPGAAAGAPGGGGGVRDGSAAPPLVGADAAGQLGAGGVGQGLPGGAAGANVGVPGSGPDSSGVPSTTAAAAAGGPPSGPGLDAAQMQQQMAAAFGGVGGGVGQGGAYGALNGSGQGGGQDYYNTYAAQYGSLGAGGYGFGAAGQAANGGGVNGAQGC